MKEKYILEKASFGYWYVNYGQVNRVSDDAWIFDADGNELCKLRLVDAAIVVYAHNRLVDALNAAIGDDASPGARLSAAVMAATEVQK